VPLAERTLARVRAYEQSARPRPWGCPARHQQTPLPPTPLRKPLKRVVRQRGIATDASIHTRRPSYATPLLARGISWRVIQALLGHTSPQTTARSTHRTAHIFDVVHATINALMADLSTRPSMGMPEVADVVQRDGRAYRERFGEDLLPSHRRAMDDIIHYRTEALGGHLFPCEPCGHEQDAYHSCRHRSCPTGHGHETQAWRADRRRALLPVPSCPVVFPLPQALRPLVRSHQNDLYDLLLRAAAQALIKLAADPHDVGGVIGILGVLHTWTRALVYPPHVHGLVPAGGVSPDRTQGQPARQTYLMPVRALSKRFRGLFGALVHQDRPDLVLPESVWTTEWVVYCQPPRPRDRARVARRGSVCLPDRPDQPPPALARGRPGVFPLPGLPASPLADHDPTSAGVHPPLAAARAA